MSMVQRPPTIDMLPDGTFRAPPQPPRVPFSLKLGVGAVLVAVVGLSLSVAALAIWFVSLILPVVVIAGVVAWGALRFRRWQLLRGAGHVVPRQPSGFSQ